MEPFTLPANGRKHGILQAGKSIEIKTIAVEKEMKTTFEEAQS